MTNLKIVGSLRCLGIAMLGLALASGCHGDKQSLVVVALTANPAAVELTMVTIQVGEKSKSFSLPASGLSSVPVKFGVWVSGGIPAGTGVTVRATGGCAYSNSSSTSSTDAVPTGSTANVAVELHPDCADGGVPDGAGGSGGGSGGTAGRSGTGGSGTGGTGIGGGIVGSGGTVGSGGVAGGGPGTGGRGTGGTGIGGAGTGGAAGATVNPPTLSGCIEYDHNAANNLPCNETTHVGDWSVRSVAFSPDGKYVASAADDGRIKIWKFDGKSLMDEGHAFSLGRQSYVAFSPDGTLLAAGSRATIALWNVGTWTARLNLTGVTGDIYDLAFTPNGQSIVSIDSDKKMYLHGLSGAPTTIGPFVGSPSVLAVSPSTVTTGVFAAVGFSSGDLSVYSVGATTISATPTATIHPATDSTRPDIGAVRFSPDGKLLAVGTEDAKVHFWNFPFANMAAPVGNSLVLDANRDDGYQSVNGVSFSPSGGYLAVATGGFSAGGGGTIWDVAARGQLGGFAAPAKYYFLSVAFAPSGGAIVFGEAACGKVALCAN